ncbi:MAG: YibE/F family protein, partial [Actinomycetota bacterium]
MGHEHHHHHHGEPFSVTPETKRKLTLAITPFIVATVMGLVAYWPAQQKIELPGTSPAEQQRFEGTVTSVDRAPCEQPGQEDFDCAVATVELHQGPDEGDTVDLNIAEGANARHIEKGDPVLVGRAAQGLPGQEYFFLDFQRQTPMLLLVGLFATVVIALSRWRGFASLIGLATSLSILVMFVLPAILEGSSPILVSIFGGAAIMFVTLYLAHGFNAMTTTALLGTFASLALTGTLAVIFVDAVRFTGFGSEEAVFLQVAAQQINLEGLLLGSIVIGTLGVLDDVTVTQASAVWELHRANPALGSLGLYRAAVRIGRDHIASTVNTLVLAYAGAALAEIAGCFSFWAWLRLDKSPWWLVPGGV